MSVSPTTNNQVTAYQVITAQAQLLEFCQQVREQGWVAIDSEFVRTRTYYAKLGLLQANCGHGAVLIDPLVGLDLKPFWRLVGDADIVKVMHAAGEDIQLFWQQGGVQPQHLLDSQIAAAFLGWGDSLGYAALVERYYDISLDKSQSRTDWLARPLSEAQLAYAADDVIYLARFYADLRERLVSEERLQLTLQESAQQVDKRCFEPPLALRYLDVGNAWQLNTRQLAVLRELCQWRVSRAQQQDIPLNFVVKEGALMALAKRPPQQKQHLYQIEGLPPITRKYAADEMMACVERGLSLNDDELPPVLQRLTHMPRYQECFDRIKALVAEQAERLQIGTAQIASRKQINDAMQWCWQYQPSIQAQLNPPDLLQGWREQLLGAEIRAILR
ncbi:ribonuclease D [Idiomarina xiamenensis]|uniref:Ribonuclease D n=1 Tax=Idiomarina xiamenensis 10-D-4 TaxID=740709 RepID=K2JHI7_9GAMM|nr:ribonuclease D [Idiomarina xiamenensis]EKE82821.1 ribonuclease D [Idiomarina xiamenensis 10-D-4]